jgi:hypothetical protein
MRAPALALLALMALPLGGCAAGIAASAIGAAARSADDAPGPNANLSPAALEACRARAAEQGEVAIIDVERRNSGRVIVWGTVRSPSARRAFECRFDGEITRFRLRPVAAR